MDLTPKMSLKVRKRTMVVGDRALRYAVNVWRLLRAVGGMYTCIERTYFLVR